MYNDDDFNHNHGIALAATRNYKAAEEALLLIHNEAYKQVQNDFHYCITEGFLWTETK